jgi:hypothetical protein
MWTVMWKEYIGTSIERFILRGRTRTSRNLRQAFLILGWTIPLVAYVGGLYRFRLDCIGAHYNTCFAHTDCPQIALLPTWAGEQGTVLTNVSHGNYMVGTGPASCVYSTLDVDGISTLIEQCYPMPQCISEFAKEARCSRDACMADVASCECPALTSVVSIAGHASCIVLTTLTVWVCVNLLVFDTNKRRKHGFDDDALLNATDFREALATTTNRRSAATIEIR